MKKKIEIIQAKRDYYRQSAMVIHPDNNQIIISSAEKERLSILEISQERMRWGVNAHLIGVSQMILTPNGRYLITGGQSWDEGDRREDLSCIKIWEVDGWKLVRQLRGHDWTVTGLGITPDLQYLISSGIRYDDDIKLWDLKRDSFKILESLDKGFRGCAISPNGKYYACIEGLFDRKSRCIVFDFPDRSCDFFQFSSNGEMLLCGGGFMRGFYIVQLTLPNITIQKYCDSIGVPNLRHCHARFSPNNHYVVFVSPDKKHFLVIVEVKTGEIAESYSMEDHPEVSNILQELYRKNKNPLMSDKIPSPLWETLAVSQDGRIILGLSNRIFIITPEIDLSFKTKILSNDPEIHNPNQNEVFIHGERHDSREYLQIYEKYNLPANEIRGLLRIATICEGGLYFYENADLIEDRIAIIKENHVIELNMSSLDSPVYPTPQEFPYLEILRGEELKISENLSLHKHLRIIDLQNEPDIKPEYLINMPQLEFIGFINPESLPPEMRNRAFSGVILSPLEVEALVEWEGILHQELYPYDTLLSYFMYSEKHVNQIVLRWDDDNMYLIYDDEEFKNFLDTSQFPLSSGNLKWLTLAEIPDLGLIHFPKVIQSWSKLQELKIFVQCLSIPAWLTKISSLQKLVVQGDSIIEIPLELPPFCPQCKISWHPVYEPYYEGKTLIEIAEMCNISSDKNFHRNRPKFSSREKKVPRSDQIISFRFLDLRFCNLSSLASIQDDTKEVTHLYLRHNLLEDLEAFPLTGENLKVVDLGENNLQNLVGIPINLIKIHTILVDGNPLRSLSGLPRKLFERTLILNFWGKKKQEYPLHSRIKTLLSKVFKEPSSHFDRPMTTKSWIVEFDEEILEKIIKYYEKTPRMLVDVVISNPASIPEEINERLCHEGGYKERQMLEQHLPPYHPILVAINQRLQ